MKTGRAPGLVIFLFGLAAISLAQTPPSGTGRLIPNDAEKHFRGLPTSDSFGPNESTVNIDGSAFSPIDSTVTYSWLPDNERYRTGGGSIAWFDAGLNLPTGSVIDHIAWEVYDNDPASDMGGWFYACPTATACDLYGSDSTTGTPGWTFVNSITLGLTIDNLNNRYFVEIFVGTDTTGLERFRRAVIYYHLQVSPPPDTADFNDVPTGHPYFQFVEALFRSGITAGCGGGNFCPDSPVTRGQMAVFVAKALGLYWPN